MGDAAFVALVRQLDAEIARIDGHGFSGRPSRRGRPWRSASGSRYHSGSRTRPATSPARTRLATCSDCCSSWRWWSDSALRAQRHTRTSRSRAVATRRWPPPSWRRREAAVCRCSCRPTPTRGSWHASARCEPAYVSAGESRACLETPRSRPSGRRLRLGPCRSRARATRTAWQSKVARRSATRWSQAWRPRGPSWTTLSSRWVAVHWRAPSLPLSPSLSPWGSCRARRACTQCRQKAHGL